MPSASVTASFTRSVKSRLQRSNLVMPTPITHTLRLAMMAGAYRRHSAAARPGRTGTYATCGGRPPLLRCRLRETGRREEGLAMRNVIRGLVVASLLLG